MPCALKQNTPYLFDLTWKVKEQNSLISMSSVANIREREKQIPTWTLNTWWLWCALTPGYNTSAHLRASRFTNWGKSLQSTSHLIWGMWGSRKCHCGYQLTVQPSGIKSRRVVARARRCARQLVVSKRISEADYCLNPFFHSVPTNCHFSLSFTIANENTDRSGDSSKEVAHSGNTCWWR